MSETITFSPSLSLFGFGALGRINGLLASRGYKRLLIITDRQIAESGILHRVLDLLKGSIRAEVFDGTPAEPSSNDVDRVTQHYGPEFDALLGLGGGSSMDFAKAMSIIMTHGGTLGDYLGEGSVPGPVIPVVCIPTTSGTGSQSTQTTVFTLNGIKRGASSEYIRPVFSIVDPELTMDLPPIVTRNSGYDALMHAIESFVALSSSQVPERPILYQGSNPFSRSMALEAFRSIWRSYRTAVSDGSNREARMDMSLGAHMAGMAFSHSGLGLVHALASSLGGMVAYPHGVCLAACTNIGLRFNLKACETKYAFLATLMKEIEGSPSGAASQDFFLHLQTLLEDLELPSRPSDLGIKKEDARLILEKTRVQTRRIVTNPRPLDETLLGYIEDGI